MRNLYQFILRNNFFFLFLLLEALAIALTASYQQYQQAYFLHSANRVSSRLNQGVSSLGDYLNLQRINRQLMKENTRLLEQMGENFLVTDLNTFVSGDSLFQRRFTYQYARVINHSVNRRNNYMTINKGRSHGIEADMGVISPHGVLGIVTNVSEHFSAVMSLLHSDMMVSVKLEKNDHIGSLRWEGGDYRRAHVHYIPPHVEIAAGDTIMTSGFSTVFPENIFVGVVEDWELRRGDTFLTLTIKLAEDFNRISHVYVVDNLLKEEQMELESAFQSPE